MQKFVAERKKFHRIKEIANNLSIREFS